MISWSMLYLISEWIIRLVMIVVVTHRRAPIPATAWLLVIFFQPWVGLVLFLLIGENRLPKRRLDTHARLLAEIDAIRQRFREHPHVVAPNMGPGLTQMVKLAERLGYMPILDGNALELISDTNEVVDLMIRDIDNARNHVHVLFYIYADDHTGQRFADALARAERRGVTCRVLVDTVGSRPMLQTLAPRMKADGIEIHAALPVGFFRGTAGRLDIRTHRKLVVIDGRIGYTGSQNLVDSSYGRKNLTWYDLMARIRGPAALELQTVFLQDWYFETDEILDNQEVFPDPEIAGSAAIQVLPSGPNYPSENYQRMVVAAIHGARRHVIITTPYFVPDVVFLQAIETAVMRGVKVEVVVPQHSDQIIVGAAARGYYEHVLESGVIVHLYQPGLVHAKTVSIDDSVAFVGSSNIDIRSFSLMFEIDLVCYGPAVTEALRFKQHEFIAESVPLELQAWRRRPFIHKVLPNVAKLMSPYL